MIKDGAGKVARSIPLKDAWHYFASPQNKASLAHLQSLRFPTARKAESFADGVSQLANFVNSRQQISAAIRAVAEQTKFNLRKSLSDGGRSAWGYLTNPDGQIVKQSIPASFWDAAEIDWETSSAKDSLQEFHRVRIDEESKTDEPPPPTDSINETATEPTERSSASLEARTNAKGGRPTNKEIIYAALEAALDDFPDLGEKSHKEITHLLRHRLQQDMPDLNFYGKGFSDKTFEKHQVIFFRHIKDL